MNRQIRRVSLVMLALFAALLVNLNLLQIVRGPSLVDNPANRRVLVAEYGIERGPILVDDQPIAESVETTDELAYLREYTDPELYAHVTGHDSFVQGRTGLEAAYNDVLTGAPSEVLAQNLTELLIGRDPRGNQVRLTIDPAVQQAAAEALAGRTGAVVAIEPASGRVLADYASPTYDPNRLASHDGTDVQEAWNELRLDPDQPLLDRSTRVLFPPGSTFKLVVAAAALEQGLQPETAFDNLEEYRAPGTQTPIGNAGGARCVDQATISLQDAFRVSCNTVFAELAVDLGPEAIVSTAEALGFNRTIPFELPVAASEIPADLDDPALAQSAIGQRDVRMTAFHAAMVAATIANAGTAMRPHVVADVLSPDGRPLSGANEGVWREEGFSDQAISAQTASLLRDMMVGVVDSGTGTAARIGGVEVGGKTGTADDPNIDGQIAWFMGFAGNDIAVAVVLPDVQAGGGTLAAPVAQKVMLAWLQQ